jgi:hypothetical protein
MAQKERELISERTRAALAAAKARRQAFGGDRGHRPTVAPDAGAAALERRLVAEQAAHRLALEVERLRAEGVTGQAAMARALTERGVPTPRGYRVWTHTTVARVTGRVAALSQHPAAPALIGAGWDKVMAIQDPCRDQGRAA